MEGIEGKVYPKKLPVIIGSCGITIFIRNVKGTGKAIIKGKVNGETIEIEIPVDCSKYNLGDNISKLTALKAIRANDVENKVKESMRYNVLTNDTAFVLHHKIDDKVEEIGKTKVIDLTSTCCDDVCVLMHL